MPIPSRSFFRQLRIIAGVALVLCVACDSPRRRLGEESEVAPAFELMPKIDVHAHIFEFMPELVTMMRSNNLSIINVCNRGQDGYLETMHRVARDMVQVEPGLFPFASCFDLTRIEEAGYADDVIAWLDRTYRDGAVMTKIWKEIGVELRRKDGSFVLPDDPVFDPIYAFMAREGKPLMAHIADPIDGWLPLDPLSAHYGYFANNPKFHLHGKPEYPRHEELVTARNRIMEKHPRLTVIGAHLGSLEHDLEALGRTLDRYPNFYVDCAARTRDLTRMSPAKVRDFFKGYQDRVLYGVDMTWKPFQRARPPTELQRAAFVRSLEARYRADYRFYGGSGLVEYDGKPVEALGLPAMTLRKLYFENANRVILNRQ